MDRLEVLQDMTMTNQENVQRQINELTDLKLQLDKKLQDLDMDVTKAQGVLSSDGTGKIDQLKMNYKIPKNQFKMIYNK